MNTPRWRSGMARVLKGSHSFTRIHPLTEWAIPAFAFPVEAGTYLPTLEGWKAELALVSRWLWFHFKNVIVWSPIVVLFVKKSAMFFIHFRAVSRWSTIESSPLWLSMTESVEISQNSI